MRYLQMPVILGLALATMFAQAPGGLQPQPPGPGVAGHWTGKMTMILAASKREVTLPLDLELEQNGNNVTGKLLMRGNRTIPARGIEENGKLNLLFDFNEAEHCRLHLTIEGETLNGSLFNYHDNPQKWDVDETGSVALTRSK
jgi:hypothetical protein